MVNGWEEWKNDKMLGNCNRLTRLSAKTLKWWKQRQSITGRVNKVNFLECLQITIAISYWIIFVIDFWPGFFQQHDMHASVQCSVRNSKTDFTLLSYKSHIEAINSILTCSSTIGVNSSFIHMNWQSNFSLIISLNAGFICYVNSNFSTLFVKIKW